MAPTSDVLSASLPHLTRSRNRDMQAPPTVRSHRSFEWLDRSTGLRPATGFRPMDYSVPGRGGFRERPGELGLWEFSTLRFEDSFTCTQPYRSGFGYTYVNRRQSSCADKKYLFDFFIPIICILPRHSTISLVGP